MSTPGTPTASTRRAQITADNAIDDEDEDESLLPDAEKSTREDGQGGANNADDEDGVLFEDDEAAKQAAFSGQINEDMKYVVLYYFCGLLAPYRLYSRRIMHESFDAEQAERFSLFRSTAFKSAALKRVRVSLVVTRALCVEHTV